MMTYDNLMRLADDLEAGRLSRRDLRCRYGHAVADAVLAERRRRVYDRHTEARAASLAASTEGTEDAEAALADEEHFCQMCHGGFDEALTAAADGRYLCADCHRRAADDAAYVAWREAATMQIEAAAAAGGWGVSVRQAETTRTEYWELTRARGDECERLVIRLSDHAAVYGGWDYSVVRADADDDINVVCAVLRS